MLIATTRRSMNLVDYLIVPVLETRKDWPCDLVAQKVLVNPEQQAPMIGIDRISDQALVIPVSDRQRSFTAQDGSIQRSGHVLEFIVK